MADLLPVIETIEHRWMRAWVGRDLKTLKGLTARNFRFVMGSRPCVILDARSWLDAAATRFLCSNYRFGDRYARDVGPGVVFATQLEMDATMDGADWSGEFWVTDIWKRARVRRSWRLVERVLSRPDDNPQVPAALRSLQLWR